MELFSIYSMSTGDAALLGNLAGDWVADFFFCYCCCIDDEEDESSCFFSTTAGGGVGIF